MAPPADRAHSDPDGARWARRADVLWRRSIGAVVLARPGPDGGDPVVVSGGGAGVWELLETPRTLSGLTDALSELYEGEPGVIREEVLALLEDLEARGFVWREGPDPATGPAGGGLVSSQPGGSG